MTSTQILLPLLFVLISFSSADTDDDNDLQDCEDTLLASTPQWRYVKSVNGQCSPGQLVTRCEVDDDHDGHHEFCVFNTNCPEK